MRKALLCIALLAMTLPAQAATAPKPSIASFQQLPVVTMQPYDETANADAQVAAAFARAQKSHKRVLIDLGGNWCVDCLVLTAVMDLPKAQAFVDQHFEVVTVDVGRFDKNLHVPARYGVQLKAVPCVVVVDRAGKQVNKGQELALGSASQLSPQAVLDQLAAWIP